MNYLEHEKLKKVQEQSQLCGEFLEFLQSKYFMIDKEDNFDNLYIQLGYMSYINFGRVLAEFFGIDLEEIEKEKRQMLDELRAG